VPFLTSRFLTHPEQVAALYRPLYRLRSLPPERPSEPVSGDVQSVRAAELPEASAASAASFEAVEDAANSAREVTMQLDIRFWRSRWFWRLAVKATMRFFRP
jgi:hypothetical protein